MYSVKITNNGTSQFFAKTKDGEFVIDTMGSGVTPPDTLLASLGSCIGVYIRKYCEGVKISLPEFSLNIEADLSREKPICFRGIHVTIDLKNNQLDERRKSALLSFIQHCPVHQTLKNNPHVHVKIAEEKI